MATTVGDELTRLQRDIDGLLEANRLEWQELAGKPMSREERLGVRKSISLRNEELLDLLERKWALIEGRKL